MTTEFYSRGRWRPEQLLPGNLSAGSARPNKIAACPFSDHLNTRHSIYRFVDDLSGGKHRQCLAKLFYCRISRLQEPFLYRKPYSHVIVQRHILYLLYFPYYFYLSETALSLKRNYRFISIIYHKSPKNKIAHVVKWANHTV